MPMPTSPPPEEEGKKKGGEKEIQYTSPRYASRGAYRYPVYIREKYINPRELRASAGLVSFRFRGKPHLTPGERERALKRMREYLAFPNVLFHEISQVEDPNTPGVGTILYALVADTPHGKELIHQQATRLGLVARQNEALSPFFVERLRSGPLLSRGEERGEEKPPFPPKE